ncbi:uncharacterized protein [Halyomorpha halys]|uniref:uncharacterized protein n=1 Tax=Halyomorpha halys TaxID=286706 RepID=UPI0006D4E66B|nr:uncharacterized protein LOC106678873 [Halyomorpha halys]
MDGKTKKILRKKIVTPKKRKSQVGLTDRIHNAVHELKRYESPEILREVNNIITPVASPAYPLRNRYPKSGSTPFTQEENFRSKLSSFGVNRSSPFNTSSYTWKSPPQVRKIVPIYPPKEISMAAYLKNETKNTMSPKAGHGKYQMPYQSKPNQGMNRNGPIPLRKPVTQALGRNRRITNRIDKHQKESVVRYATIMPVQELINKPERPTHKRSKNPSKGCPAHLQRTRPTTPQRFKNKRPVRKNACSYYKGNNVVYNVSPPDVGYKHKYEIVEKVKQEKLVRSKNRTTTRPKAIAKHTDHVATFRMEQTQGDNQWNSTDMKSPRKPDFRNRGVGTPTSRSSQSDNVERLLVAGCSGGPDVSYRMCKQCPLRQLIAKIDPAVAKDKKSYPVVAFTCCRKAPNVKDSSTSP